MDSKLTLTTYKMATNTRKIQALAKLGNITNIEYVFTAKTSEDFTSHISKSSTNSLPLLTTSEGSISETGAILQYLGAKSGLAGSNDFEKAQVTQWLAFSYQEVGFNRFFTLYPILGYVEFDAEKNKMQSEMLKNNLKALSSHLEGKSYLVGDKATIADIELWANLLPLWQLVFPTELRNKLFPNVEKWFINLSKQDFILKTFGPTTTCKAVQKPPRVEKKKEEKKPEVKQEKKEVKEKEEKPSDAIDNLPPSKMVFDDFKKDFMNSKDRKEVMTRFWKETLDKEGYCFYFTKYQKLPSEGKVLFKTSNGASFFMQKIDSYRKYAFATFGVYGEEDNYDIIGCWMFRGPGIPFFMEQHESFEYHDRRRLNPEVEEDRALIEAYWLNLEEGKVVDGRKVCEVSTFK